MNLSLRWRTLGKCGQISSISKLTRVSARTICFSPDANFATLDTRDRSFTLPASEEGLYDVEQRRVVCTTIGGAEVGRGAQFAAQGRDSRCWGTAGDAASTRCSCQMMGNAATQRAPIAQKPAGPKRA
jgi:hypothetical protein